MRLSMLASVRVRVLRLILLSPVRCGFQDLLQQTQRKSQGAKHGSCQRAGDRGGHGLWTGPVSHNQAVRTRRGQGYIRDGTHSERKKAPGLVHCKGPASPPPI